MILIINPSQTQCSEVFEKYIFNPTALRADIKIDHHSLPRPKLIISLLRLEILQNTGIIRPSASLNTVPRCLLSTFILPTLHRCWTMSCALLCWLDTRQRIVSTGPWSRHGNVVRSCSQKFGSIGTIRATLSAY
jgi:hypothetical protein